MARKRKKRSANDASGAPPSSERSERIERVDTSGRTLAPIYRRKPEPPATRKMRRSDVIWLALVGLVVVTPAIYEATATPIRRNLYASWADCVADYSTDECEKHQSYSDPDPANDQRHSGYHGPWYREGSLGRSAGDPGPGRHYEQIGTDHRDQTSGSGGPSRSNPPIATEPGTMRGGFGRTAASRSSRWSFGG